MEDYLKGNELAVTAGYIVMPDHRKVIYDLKVYYQDERIILENDTPDHSQTMSFAVFRATLYHWGLGKDSDTDYDTYKLYLQNRNLNNLRCNTLYFPKIMEIKSDEEQLIQQFKKEIASPQKPFIISSFHYGSYKVLFNYMAYHGFTVYLIASRSIIEENIKSSEFYVSAINMERGCHSAVKFICADDFNSMLILAELASTNSINHKTVFLLFPDGNIGSKKNIDTKRFEPIQFMGKELWVRKGLFMFAEIFDIPIYNVIADSDINNKTTIDVQYYVESPKSFKKNKINILNLFYNVLEKCLLSKKLYKWECWVYIHSWHEHLIPPAEDQEMVSLKNYEENRFTQFTIDKDNFVFDSKYYLSYPISWDGIEALTDIILKTNIVL